MRTRAERRKNDFKKAIHKKNVAEHDLGVFSYDNVHQYSKNNIYFESEPKEFGELKNQTHSDRIKTDSMESKIAEYDN